MRQHHPPLGKDEELEAVTFFGKKYLPFLGQEINWVKGNGLGQWSLNCGRLAECGPLLALILGHLFNALI